MSDNKLDQPLPEWATKVDIWSSTFDPINLVWIPGSLQTSGIDAVIYGALGRGQFAVSITAGAFSHVVLLPVGVTIFDALEYGLGTIALPTPSFLAWPSGGAPNLFVQAAEHRACGAPGDHLRLYCLRYQSAPTAVSV